MRSGSWSPRDRGRLHLTRSAKPLWRRIAGFLFVGSAFAFLGLYVGHNAAELRAHTWQVDPALILASWLVNIAGLLWGVHVWQRLLQRLGPSVSFRDLARVWFVSGLGRYIPGKIWQFVGAAHLGTGSGLPAALTVTSLAAHTLFFIIGAFFTAILLLPTDLAGTASTALVVARWLSPLALLLVHPRVIDLALGIARRVSRQPLQSWQGTWADGVVLVAFSIVGWVATGGALFLFIRGLTPIPLDALGPIIGINALAFVVGYLVFVAPAGLGAKEGALTILLSIYVPPPVAAILAIMTRLWTVAAEVIPALVLLAPRASNSTGEASSAEGRR